MANKYIKLGPIGDSFTDSKLGIYLSPNNAAEVDSTLLDLRLKSFISTGFLVEINKVEYDNLKLQLANTSNIPLNVLSINSTLSLDPVEAVRSDPPFATLVGQRYLVNSSATSSWAGKTDYIANWNGLQWDFIKPENGMILPVYEWGVSIHYTGTYPSGSWDIPTDAQVFISNPTTENPTPTGQEYALELFLKEQKARESADKALIALIDDFIKEYSAPTASNIEIIDSEGLFEASTVEMALTELGRTLFNIYSLLEQIKSFLDGGYAAYTFEGVLNIEQEHTFGNAVIWKVFDIDLNRLIQVHPYELTATVIKIEFTRVRNIILYLR